MEVRKFPKIQYKETRRWKILVMERMEIRMRKYCLCCLKET